MPTAVESLIGAGTDDEFRGHIGAASAAALAAVEADVAALGAPAGVAYAMARGGKGAVLTSGDRVILSGVAIPQALRVGDVLTIELPYEARNLGTASGDLIIETYFAPTARGDLAYSFAGLSQTFSATAHSSGHLLYKYNIISPGAALNAMGTSGATSGNHTYGKQTNSSFLAEVPTGIGSYTDAYPLWTDGLLTMYITARSSSAGAEDWVWIGPAEVRVVSAGAAGAGVTMGAVAAVTHTATLPGSTTFKGPAIAAITGGRPISGNGAGFASVGADALASAVWGFTANPAVPMYAQDWEFISASSGTSYTLHTNPLLAQSQTPVTGATMAAVIATLGAGAMTGDVSGQPALSYVTCPADAAKKAFRFYGHRQDTPTQQVANAGFRAELDCIPRIGDGICSPGDEVWIACRIVFGASSSELALNAGSTCEIWQIHAGAINSYKASPGLSLQVTGGNLVLRRFWPTSDSYVDITPFVAASNTVVTSPATATAHTIVTRVVIKGGSQAASGILQGWHNGTQTVNITGGTGYPEAQCESHRPHSVHYMKAGVYTYSHASASASENGHVHYRGLVMWRNPGAGFAEAMARAAIELY